MAGLISAFMAGAANFGAKQIERSLIEDAQAERDARLAEITREGQRYGSQLATEREAATETRAEGRRKELGEAVTKARTGQVDDLSGSVRDRNPREAMEAEREVYAGRGLVQERMRAEEMIQRDEEGRDRKLERADVRADRQRDNDRADRADLRADRADLRADRTEARLGAMAKADSELKGIQKQAAELDLKQKQTIQAAWDVYAKAKTPEDQAKALTDFRRISGKTGLPDGTKEVLGIYEADLKTAVSPDEKQAIHDKYKPFMDKVSTAFGVSTSSSGEPVRPKTKADVDALVPGALFVNPADGKTYRKKGAAAAAARPEPTKGEDIGYDASNPIQFKQVVDNITQPSFRAQAQAWLDGNALDAQQRKRVKILLGQQ